MQQKELILLIKQCKRHNRKAQEQVYELYYRAMFNTALRIVKNRSMAEDVMQEAFITAFTKIQHLTEAVTFSKWLKTIVVNKALKQLQRENKFLSLHQEHNVVEEGLEVDSKTQQQYESVLEAISQLKENYRIMLTLHYIEGYDYEELVTITGCSPGNCRTILSRAKESLRKKMKPCLKMMN